MGPWRGPRSDGFANGIFWATVALAVVALPLTIYVWADLAAVDAYPTLFSIFSGVLYAALGALILRRARNRVGWILELSGLAAILVTLVSVYAMAAMRPGGLRLPGASSVGALAEPVFSAMLISLAFLVLIFPTGTLPSPRWQPIVWIGAMAGAATVVLMTIIPANQPLPAPGGISLVYPNPFRVDSALLSGALVVAIWIVAFVAVAAFASLVLRYRSGGREERQQLKWLALMIAQPGHPASRGLSRSVSADAIGLHSPPASSSAWHRSSSSESRPRSRSRS